jgi:hypothetical protein
VRRAAHVDANQPAIVQALLDAGCTVQSLAQVGLGCPDILVGYAGVNVLMEVKNLDGLNGNVRRGFGLSKEQLSWQGRWKGQVTTVHGPEEAIEVVKQALARETGKREGAT